MLGYTLELMLNTCYFFTGVTNVVKWDKQYLLSLFITVAEKDTDYSLNVPVNIDDNKKLFNGLVFQTILKNLPSNMPDFDRVNIVAMLKTELGKESIKKIV